MSDETFVIDIIDNASGETVSREMTEDEIADFLARRNAYQAEQEAKAAARESALAKLADLGLTAEEIAAL